MTGNNILFSRALLVFDSKFDKDPVMQLMKEILTQVFTINTTNPNYKPFIDHTFSFSIVDGCIHFRHFEMIPSDKSNVEHALADTLVEIGPRWSFKVEKVFDDQGQIIYKDIIAKKSEVRLNEINDLKRKRKQINSKKFKDRHENQKMVDENPDRTLRIRKAIRGEE
mmetsp:Transcript_27396/g.60214  ORF Transcript_27396/g.60214 Transcript_27396/m.60214 type:complete len:167 (+) Transcript_27396:545-1045(+)